MTRVGQYTWNVDILRMQDDELSALADVVEFELEHRRKLAEYNKKLRKLLEEAEADGVQLIYCENDLWSRPLTSKNCKAAI